MRAQTRGSSGRDVVSDIVFDWTLGATGSNDGGELVEDDLKLVLQCPRRETGAGGLRERGNALYLQVCESVGEAVASHMDEEGEVTEEVGTKNWMLDIDDEDPAEGASESKIVGEGSSAESHYRCVIDCSQAGAILLLRAFGAGRRDDTHFGTGIDQKRSAEDLSVTLNRRLGSRPEALVATTARPARFLTWTWNRAGDTSWHPHRTSGDTSRGRCQVGSMGGQGWGNAHGRAKVGGVARLRRGTG